MTPPGHQLQRGSQDMLTMGAWDLQLAGEVGSPVPRAQIHSKPPREQLGTMDIAIGLTSCFLCFLLPSGWVLSHLESYKKRE
ncbi:cytochrome c oxidase subunit 8A, mitochondrial-like [Dama dama]